jgi:hypothetical protein
MNKYNRSTVKIAVPPDNHWQGDIENEFEVCPECADKLTKMLTLGFYTYTDLLEEGYNPDEM